MARGGCGRAPDSYHTGTKCSRRIARRAAARSSASSSKVEEMNTRTRWPGVKITSVSAITSQASPQPRRHEDHLRQAGSANLSWPCCDKTAYPQTDLLCDRCPPGPLPAGPRWLAWRRREDGTAGAPVEGPECLFGVLPLSALLVAAGAAVAVTAADPADRGHMDGVVKPPVPAPRLVLRLRLYPSAARARRVASQPQQPTVLRGCPLPPGVMR